MSFVKNLSDVLNVGTIEVHHPEIMTRLADRERVLLATAMLDAIAEEDEDKLQHLLAAGADPRVAGVFCASESYPVIPGQFKSIVAFGMISPIAFALAKSMLGFMEQMLKGTTGLSFVAHDRLLLTEQTSLRHPAADFYCLAAEGIGWERIEAYARQNVKPVSLLQLVLEVNSQFIETSTPDHHLKSRPSRWRCMKSVLMATSIPQDEIQEELWRLTARSITNCTRDIDTQFVPCEMRLAVDMLEQFALPPGDLEEQKRRWLEAFSATAQGTTEDDMSVLDDVTMKMAPAFRLMVKISRSHVAQRHTTIIWKAGFLQRHFIDEDTPRSRRISAMWSNMSWSKDIGKMDEMGRILRHALATGLSASSTFSGYPLLHLAAGFDAPEWIQMLLEAGADVDQTHLVPQLDEDDDPAPLTALQVAQAVVARDAEYELLAAKSRKSIADAIARYRSDAVTDGV